MCINPKHLPNGAKTPCHKCWQCHENRINDWVGRCIAEKETCLAATTVTLTYGGGDTAESRFLRKSDMTAYLKALRNDGHKVRYFYTGEYGTKKGRAHWHCVLFWHSPMPSTPWRQNTNDSWWPHGYSFWDEATTPSVRYVMKYINKNDADEAASKSVGMSRKPMLGIRFFAELAERYVDNGLSPQRPFYRFKDVLDKYGQKPLEFYMPPLVRDKFIAFYVDAFSRRHPGKWWPPSKMVDDWHENNSGYVPELRMEKRQFGDTPWMLPPHGGRWSFDEKLNSFYADVAGKRLYWSYDEEGKRAWREEIVTPGMAIRLREAYEIQKRSGE